MRSQNGWSADPHLALRPFVVGGTSFLPGIRDDDDVEAVLRYFWTEYDKRVEPLRNPGCWGYSYRENRNDPNSLSNHASGTATDGNAPLHPNGVPTSRTFTPAQIAEVHAILAELDGVLRWGGDYTGTPDAMHVEVNTDAATLHEVADRLRGADDMTPAQDARLTAIEGKVDAVSLTLAQLVRAETRRGDNQFRREAALTKAAAAAGLDIKKILAEVQDAP